MEKSICNRLVTLAAVGLWFAFACNAAGAAKLPAGYTEVGFIESTAGGGQYINTGYRPNQNTHVAMEVTVCGTYETYFNVWDNTWHSGAFGFSNDGWQGVYVGYGDEGGSKLPNLSNGRHVVELDKNIAKVDGVVIREYGKQTFSLQNNLYLFACNNKGNAEASREQRNVLCHGCKIYEKDTLKRDFVPCIRNEDGVGGLYDTVTRTFYGNAGKGSFGCGLSSGTYEFAASVTINASARQSALKVEDGASVGLKIPAGVTVTLKGGNGDGAGGAGAGLEVPATAKLYVAGGGTLKATGGNAANGVNGGTGGIPSATSSALTSGAGGTGGAGGGGAGAGIGGRGGSGGAGGAGGAAESVGLDVAQSGNSGSDGAKGSDGAACGIVCIAPDTAVVATGGKAASSGGSGGDVPAAGKRVAYVEVSDWYYATFCGGGGGGGLSGLKAANIGSGGGGGNGGGGGGSGAFRYKWRWNSIRSLDGWGWGGANNGVKADKDGDDWTGEDSSGDVSGGRGGSILSEKAKEGSAVATGLTCIYVDEKGVERVVTRPCTAVTSETKAFDAGWYVVTGNVTTESGIDVPSGCTANLILTDGSFLKVTGQGQYCGIDARPGEALNIYGQINGTGRFEVTGGNRSAGIGGGDTLAACGTVTINGGVVVATGGAADCAGIGGGWGGPGGTVTINGGEVIATGGSSGAGIGGGDNVVGGTVTIGSENGTALVKAGRNGFLSGMSAEEFVSSHNGFQVAHVLFVNKTMGRLNVPTVSGLDCTVSRAGAKVEPWESDGTAVYVAPKGTSLSVTFTPLPGYEFVGSNPKEKSITIDGDVTIAAADLPKVVRTEEVPPIGYLDLNDDRSGLTGRVRDGYLAVNEQTTLEAGEWYAVTDSVNLSHALKVLGTPGCPTHLILGEGAALTVKGNDDEAGIAVPAGRALVIHGPTNGIGRVMATGGKSATGIGGDKGSAGGMVTVYGATVTAQGNQTAAIDAEVMIGAAFEGGVLAGENAANVTYLPAKTYVQNHSAHYVTMPAEPPLPEPSELPFDGVLTQGGRPIVNATNVTAVVRVDGEDHDVAIRTDADGRFAASLPRQAMPTSKVVFVSAKVGDRTIEVDRPLTVPQLPYAFGADYADEVVADGEFTVVDSEVTVVGDLTVAEDVTTENDSIVGSVNGGITVGRPSSAKTVVLKAVDATDDTARIFGIGDPITVFDAHLEGEVLNEFVGYTNTNMLYAYLAPKSQYSATVEQFQIDRAANFVFGTTPCRSPKFAPENLYGAFPGTDMSKFFAYTAEADGFVTVEIRSAQSYGGIALTVDFKDSKADAPWCHAFEQGWHRSAWNPQRWGVYETDSRREAERPAFNREYTFAIRRGETMHVRTLLQANFETETRLPGTSGEFIVSRMQCKSAIDLHVKVSFRPIGFAK